MGDDVVGMRGTGAIMADWPPEVKGWMASGLNDEASMVCDMRERYMIV